MMPVETVNESYEYYWVFNAVTCLEDVPFELSSNWDLINQSSKEEILEILERDVSERKLRRFIAEASMLRPEERKKPYLK